MTTVYKLTDQKMKTYNGFQWALGEKKTASGNGGLCGPGFLHAYTHPLLAVLLNPIHANISKPRLFECAGTVAKADSGLKVGCTVLTLTREIGLPPITTVQSVSFAILCAKEVCKGVKWNAWADGWLSGEDRTARAAADSAARAADSAARAARAAVVAAREKTNLDLISIALKATR